MKPTHLKFAKPSINTPTTKQSHSDLSGSHYNHKQQSRYNPKLVSAVSDSTLNSPSPLIQKIGFTVQTPCRSSSKLLYIKQKYSNIAQNTQPEVSPKPTKHYTERPYYDKYSEASSLQSSMAKTSRLTSRVMQTDISKRESSFSPNEFLGQSEYGKSSSNIFGAFQKGSPTSSSQAKLTMINRKENNTVQDSIQARVYKVVASPKMKQKNSPYDSSDNKENINPLNSKSDNKNANSKKFSNGFGSKSLLNGSPEDLRNQQSTEINLHKEPVGSSCINHPHKKAKYTAVPENNALYQSREGAFYCSKCAIKLVASGCKIQELVTSSIEQRKSEVDDFLEKLSHAKGKSNLLIESIRRKKEDVEIFYSKQVEKAELIASAILKIVNEEKMHALEELSLAQEQTLEEIEDIQKQIEERLGSITSIQYDIEKNLHNILNKIDADPFKTIMSKYNEKLDYFLTFLDVDVKDHQVSVTKLPGFKREALESLKPSLLTFFDKVVVSTSLVKKEASPEKIHISCKPSPLAGGSKESLYKNSLYVSFENKEIFENAIEFSQPSTVQESQRLATKRSSDLNSYRYGQKAPQIRTDPDLSPQALDSFRGGYTSVREEPTNGVKRADFDLENALTKNSVGTPQSSRSEQIVFNSTQTKRQNGFQECSEEKLAATHRQNSKFDEPQMSLLQRSFEEIPTVRYSRFDAESNPTTHNRHESCPVPDIRVSGTKQAKSLTQLSSQANPNTMKYINILEKITTSQSRKNTEYSDLMKMNSSISPKYSLIEETSVNETETVRTDEESPDRFGQPSERMAPDSGNALKTEFESSNKELKNFPPFFHFLENKINNEKPQSAGTNYQKSLFCCSPNFKENIEPSNPE